jgi:hypothetical protein
VDLSWIIWHQQNDLMFSALQWPIENTRQVIWDNLHDYGRIEWQRNLVDLDIAYQDILTDLDST